MPEIHNIDDVLIGAASSSPATPVEEPVVAQEVEAPAREETPAPEVSADEYLPDEPAPEVAQEKEPAQESKIDEYGNEVRPPKTYTEEEVQRMMKDRLARVKQSEQPVSSQPQKENPPAEQSDNWVDELNQFVDKRLDQRDKEIQEKRWRQQEAERQAEFEEKFTSGMSKYSDFHQVVAGKPITDSMMLAARSLSNPASFVYAASKMHPQELERISRINDPYVQASEVGRLHERMVKEKRLVSQAPKPLAAPKGDMMPSKIANQPSLEDRIAQYAKQKRK